MKIPPGIRSIALAAVFLAPVAQACAASPAPGFAAEDWPAFKARQKRERETFRKQMEGGKKSFREGLAGKRAAERKMLIKAFKQTQRGQWEVFNNQQKEAAEDFRKESSRRRP